MSNLTYFDNEIEATVRFSHGRDMTYYQQIIEDKTFFPELLTGSFPRHSDLFTFIRKYAGIRKCRIIVRPECNANFRMEFPNLPIKTIGPTAQDFSSALAAVDELCDVFYFTNGIQNDPTIRVTRETWRDKFIYTNKLRRVILIWDKMR